MIRYTLKQLAYFAAAAEGRSVTGAARALGVSQPAISAAISHLEEVFGVQLFLRHHAQGLSLTPAGRRLFLAARNLLSHARELAEPASVSGEEEAAGELEIGCFITFAPYYLPALLRRFAARHPKVAVRLHEGDAEMLQQDLAIGRIELAILYDLALGTAVEREVLTELPAHTVLPREHPLARRRAVSLAALAAEPFVLLDLPHSREYFRSIFQRHGLEPDVRHRTTSYDMVRGLVAAGHGVGLLNLRISGDRSYDGTPLVCRPLEEETAPLRIVLARNPLIRPTRTARAFALCAREYFAQSEIHDGGAVALGNRRTGGKRTVHG